MKESKGEYIERVKDGIRGWYKGEVEGMKGSCREEEEEVNMEVKEIVLKIVFGGLYKYLV